MKSAIRTITLAAAIALLAGCGNASAPVGGPATAPDATETTTPPPSTSTASPATATTAPAFEIPTDPKAAGEQFVRTAYSWDARTDTGITDGLERAKPLVTAELAETFVAPERATGGVEWNDAAKNEAHTVVSIEVLPDGNQALVPASPEHKTAAFMVSWTWQNGDYTRAGGKDLVVLELVKDADGVWKVDSYSPTPVGG